jgi:hypothetical protein
MRRPVLLIFINAMILIVVFCLMTQSLVIIQRLARAEKLTGLVEVQRSGKGSFQPLAEGDMIKTSDVVRSGDNGVAEFKWADGTRWKIMPRTEITVKKSTHNSLKKADQSQLKLTAGKVFIRIVKALKPASQFEVETPTAVAAVRGTIFSVEYRNGKSEVAVFKGKVQVRSGVDEAAITPGQAAVSTAPSELAVAQDKAASADFASQQSIVLPELEAKIEALSSGAIWVQGQSESGDKVLINGRPARVLGNGMFRYRLKNAAPGQAVTVVAVDKHGARAVRKLVAPALQKTDLQKTDFQSRVLLPAPHAT